MNEISNYITPPYFALSSLSHTLKSLSNTLWFLPALSTPFYHHLLSFTSSPSLSLVSGIASQTPGKSQNTTWLQAWTKADTKHSRGKHNHTHQSKDGWLQHVNPSLWSYREFCCKTEVTSWLYMTAKGIIKVEDELKNSWCCSVKYRQCIPYAGRGKGKKNFKEQQFIENLWKMSYPTTLSRNKYKIGEGRRAWTEKMDKS